MLKLRFGEPHHGWLPVTVDIKDNSYNFEASDVPIDPVEQLASGLHAALHSQSSEIWWHLEPDGYYFDLASTNDKFTLTISFAESSKMQSKRLLCACEGSFSEIILPCWRALREFYSHQYSDPHWPAEPTSAMQKLTDEVRVRRKI